MEIVKLSHHDKCSLMVLQRVRAEYGKCSWMWKHSLALPFPFTQTQTHACYVTTIISWSNIYIYNNRKLRNAIQKDEQNANKYSQTQWQTMRAKRQPGSQAGIYERRQIQRVKHGNLSVICMKCLHFQMLDINFNFEFYLCQVFPFNAHRQKQHQQRQ